METGTKRLQRRADHTVKRLTLDTIPAHSRKAPDQFGLNWTNSGQIRPKKISFFLWPPAMSVEAPRAPRIRAYSYPPCRFVRIRVNSCQSPTSAFRLPRSNKITKRTHFQILDFAANKGKSAYSTTNSNEKRTHFDRSSNSYCRCRKRVFTCINLSTKSRFWHITISPRP